MICFGTERASRPGRPDRPPGTGRTRRSASKSSRRFQENSSSLRQRPRLGGFLDVRRSSRCSPAEVSLEKKMLQRRGDQVDEVRARHDGDEEQGDRRRGRATRSRWVARSAPSAHPQGEHGLAQQVAHRRPHGPPRLHHGQPARLHDEAGEVDHEQQREHTARSERSDPRRCGRKHEPPPHRHAEPDDEEEPEEVEHRLVERGKVRPSAACSRRGQRDVVVDRGQRPCP